MKQTIHILAILILTGCGQSNAEQEKVSHSHTLSATNSDTLSKENILSHPQKSNQEKQNQDDYRKQALHGFEKATLY